MALILTRGPRARRPALMAAWLLAVVLPLGPGSGHALDRVTLQLKWTHCLQFAGYYAAQEQVGQRVMIEPEADPREELTRVQVLLALALALAALIGGVALYVLRINRRLKRGLRDLKEAQQRLQVLSLATEQSPASVVITGPDATIEYVNPSFLRETGYTAEEVLGQNPRVIASGLTPRPVFEDMWSHLRRGEPWKGELVNRRKSGELYWEDAHIAPVKDPAGKTTHFVAVKLDVTARRMAYEQLAHLAHHDPLTDLPNRTLFFERVDQGLALARRNGTRLALMFIDLDRFKAVNDTWGHAVGDRLLQEVARRMRGCLRASDSVGRIGGDEFVVLLHEVADVTAAVQVAELIRAALETPFAIERLSLGVSASIGLALFPDHGDSAITLARAADSTMYQAKESGKNQVWVSPPETPAAHGEQSVDERRKRHRPYGPAGAGPR